MKGIYVKLYRRDVTDPVTTEDDGTFKVMDWSFRAQSGGILNNKMLIYHGPPYDTQK